MAMAGRDAAAEDRTKPGARVTVPSVVPSRAGLERALVDRLR